MAVNKRKVLDAARRHAQKGAKQKALKEYNSLLKLDPRDAKLHLEIGDCYRRWGEIPEAVAQYSRVAEQYKGDGFDARAVAILKQILNLDPKLYTAHVSLSELYQRMGLDAEALAALQSAADGYHRDGQKQEALELLRRMATLDPTNTTSRLKVAELLRQEGLEDDAVAEYEAVAAEFMRQGATESFLTAQERILDLRPDRTDVLTSIASGLIELKKPERAEPFAKRALDLDSENADIHGLLCDIYKVLGKAAELAASTRKLAKVYRDRGDEDKARELLRRLPMDVEAGAAADSTGASAVLCDGELHVDDAPGNPAPGQTEGFDPGSEGELDLEFDYEQGDEDADDFLLDDELGDSFSEERGSGAPDPALPEGDPEQLFAEACVYLRYGKRQQAIASLEAVLQQESDHRPALEKLGEAYVEVERNGDAVEVWSRAAVLAKNDEDDSGFDVLRDRIGAIDVQAAEQLGDGGAVGAAEAVAMREEPAATGQQPEEIGRDSGDSFDPDDEAELELDVVVPDEGVEAAEESPEPEIELDAAVEVDATGVEIDVDEADAEEEVEIDFDEVDATEEVAIDVDAEDAAKEVAIDVDADTAGEDDAAAHDSEPAGEESLSGRISEELEEAEFYYQQELHDEAEAVYRRILKIAPDHPSVLQRLAELAEARGEDPADGVRPPEPKQQSEPETKQPGKPKAKSPIAAAQVEAPAAGAGGDLTEVAEISIDSVDDEAVVQIDAPPAARPKVEEVASASLGRGPTGTSALQLDSAASAGSGDEGHFDLAAELRDVLEEDAGDGAGHAADAVRSTVAEGFESVFAAFKQGVSDSFSEDDYETRYDLGIAYREMELYEDAIGEFRLCLESESRRVTSLHMLGLCALDLGRPEDAASHFEEALATSGLPPGERAGIRFDLARAYEASGDVGRARSSYDAVHEHDPDFPGLQERIDAVASGGTASDGSARKDSSGSRFESFDDLVADANADGDGSGAESFESFDDVIMEAVAEADSEEEPAAGKRRKKKKISFV